MNVCVSPSMDCNRNFMTTTCVLTRQEPGSSFPPATPPPCLGPTRLKCFTVPAETDGKVCKAINLPSSDNMMSHSVCHQFQHPERTKCVTTHPIFLRAEGFRHIVE